MTRRKFFKRFAWTALSVFILMNLIAYIHAYKFTHFTDSSVVRTKDEKHLSFGGKLEALFTGIKNPRPVDSLPPLQKYETIKLQSNKIIECWSIRTENAKGTVILFHGYCGQKSALIDKSDEFIKLGYSTFLVDFMGSGGSEGNATTIGYMEAEEVKTCFDFVKKSGEGKIYLFGASMGAAAVLKAVNDYGLNPAGIILECPFGSMYQTVCARFHTMGVPVFPMAGLLVFWGGVQNDFPAFSHNPQEYAKNVKCPVLLMYGKNDEKVSQQEIDNIYSSLQGQKRLKVFSNAGHENYLKNYRGEWMGEVTSFLKQ